MTNNKRRCTICGKALPIHKGRGRPAKYCQGCKPEAKKVQDAARYNQDLPICCKTAIEAGCTWDTAKKRHRKSAVRGCSQHKVWRDFRKRAKRRQFDVENPDEKRVMSELAQAGMYSFDPIGGTKYMPRTSLTPLTAPVAPDAEGKLRQAKADLREEALYWMFPVLMRYRVDHWSFEEIAEETSKSEEEVIQEYHEEIDTALRFRDEIKAAHDKNGRN